MDELEKAEAELDKAQATWRIAMNNHYPYLARALDSWGCEVDPEYHETGRALIAAARAVDRAREIYYAVRYKKA